MPYISPNFMPWLSFFDKMNKCDTFVVMAHCQFEKNGWQNRCRVNGKYWTKPVNSGRESIITKRYVDGTRVFDLNIQLIMSMARILEIPIGKIRLDWETTLRGTDRLIDICKRLGADSYLTSPDAQDKYLDENLMKEKDIEVIYHHFPNKMHTFEAFNDFGIEGTIKLLKKSKEEWKALRSFSHT